MPRITKEAEKHVAVLPPAILAVTATAYDPASEYSCSGDDSRLDPPSPKSQATLSRVKAPSSWN